MAKQKETEISIIQIESRTARFAVLGKTPLILNRMTEKAKHEFLMPKGPKTKAEKASNMKHDPLREFKDSPYTLPDEGAPTLLAHLSTAFKKALAGAALDIPGAAKAQISRLVVVEGEKVPIYGIPKLHMSVVRQAGIARTPDVRTRAIVPEWAAYIDVTFTTPIIKEPTVANLLAAGGIMQGVGDWRPEKGSGSFGQFMLVNPDDERFVKIVSTGGREAQIAAMEDAEPYDSETEELLSWFNTEADKRGFERSR